MDDSTALRFSGIHSFYIACVNGMIIWFPEKEFYITVSTVRNHTMCTELREGNIVFKDLEKLII